MTPCYLIQINYKSGNSIRAWFKSFSLQRSITGLEVEWKLVEDKFQLLLIGVDDIESIVQITVHENVIENFNYTNTSDEYYQTFKAREYLHD